MSHCVCAWTGAGYVCPRQDTGGMFNDTTAGIFKSAITIDELSELEIYVFGRLGCGVTKPACVASIPNPELRPEDFDRIDLPTLTFTTSCTPPIAKYAPCGG